MLYRAALSKALPLRPPAAHRPTTTAPALFSKSLIRLNHPNDPKGRKGPKRPKGPNRPNRPNRLQLAILKATLTVSRSVSTATRAPFRRRESAASWSSSNTMLAFPPPNFTAPANSILTRSAAARRCASLVGCSIKFLVSPPRSHPRPLPLPHRGRGPGRGGRQASRLPDEPQASRLRHYASRLPR